MSVEQDPEAIITDAWPTIALQLRRALDAGDALDELVVYVHEARADCGVGRVRDVGVVPRAMACEVMLPADARAVMELEGPPPAGYVWILFVSDTGARVVAVEYANVLRGLGTDGAESRDRRGARERRVHYAASTPRHAATRDAALADPRRAVRPRTS